MRACFSLSSSRKGDAAGTWLLLSIPEGRGWAKNPRFLAEESPLSPPEWVIADTAVAAAVPPGPCAGRKASCPQQLRKSRGCVGPLPSAETSPGTAAGGMAHARDLPGR